MSQRNGKVETKEGVSAPASLDATGGRDEFGRFLPGVSGNPHGRPSKERERAVLAAVKDALPPEKIAEVIVALVNDSTSWRARVAGIELHLHYTLGKPVQRTQEVSDAFEEILAQLGD